MIPPELEQRLYELLRIFVEENKNLNLSAFRTEELAWTGNIMDSISFLDLLPKLGSVQSVLDLGTGGGFPLLPLALALSDVSFVGLDSVQKKVDAVNRMIEKLALKNAACIAGRAEELGRLEKYREQFDIVTSRAVAPINVLLEYCSPFVKQSGYIVLWKSMTIDEELKDSLLARAEFSCHLIHKHSYKLSGNWGERQLLAFQKTAILDSKYPRAVGVPKKDPLI